ncbi:DUF4232 domain-containing protein [Streptomyces sp. B1I3]|uniref:DUF4232 domain-containing protein n=1 Tax=Streptomyces sp. B1I3 TaxID=3042264 RepID=UPI0027891C21|nr:DUF4232 domain-containing protein [Streptomyces sp. B1I3]MDQ0795753.1 hypothetical protein [Streptomyces sp. B1I3]
MRNLRFRRAARTSALGTAAMVAALSLTACQDGGTAAVGDSASKPAGSASQEPAEGSAAPADRTSAAPVSDTGTNGSDSGSAAAQGSGSGSAKGSGAAQPAAKQPQTGNKDSGSVTLACDGGNSKLSIAPVARPVNHMLLTMTNTGSKSCNAYSYPFLKFGEAQSAPSTVEASKPQAVVTIAPGESAYAGVMTSSADGSGTGGYSTRDLTVSFQGREGSGSTGPSATVPLSKDVYVDSTLAVTYWQTGMDDALTY